MTSIRTAIAATSAALAIGTAGIASAAPARHVTRGPMCAAPWRPAIANLRDVLISQNIGLRARVAALEAEQVGMQRTVSTLIAEDGVLQAQVAQLNALLAAPH